jgi:hypothetical protein
VQLAPLGEETAEGQDGLLGDGQADVPEDHRGEDCGIAPVFEEGAQIGHGSVPHDNAGRADVDRGRAVRGGS